jgi:hypothetical protein
MTNEEMQKAIDFIVNNQAQFTSDIRQLPEVQARAEERWSRTEEGIRGLLAIAEIHEREINSLGEHARTTDERLRATGDRLNALINVLERHITEGRNGTMS